MKKGVILFIFFGLAISVWAGTAFISPKSTGGVFKGEEENPMPQEETLPIVESHEETLATMVADRTTFIEVNFSDMKTRLWREGVMERELPILAVGDPQEWGGTAAGLYSVLSKNKERYSSAAEVYMPWAVGFYGKYFLHGEPYYISGEKRFADATGGCVQSRDEDAKITYDFAQKGMPVLVIDKERGAPLRPLQKELPSLSSPSYLIADLNSGTMLAEKNSTQQRPIASLAKLMEAVVVVEQVDLRNSILVRPYMLEEYGQTQGLVADQRFRIVELFYPLLIESSNDAAKVLSYFLGSIRTIELMNAKAESLLMKDTVFTDASGFDPGNLSTAQDLFRLIRYISFNRSPILTITKGEQTNVNTYGPVRFSNLESKNLFVEHPAFAGGKTGYIIASGYIGVFLFDVPLEGETRKIAIILLGAPHQKGEQSLYQDVLNTLGWLGVNSSTLEKPAENP